MLENQTKFFRVELNPIGINLNLRNYNKSIYYFNNGLNLKFKIFLFKVLNKKDSSILLFNSFKDNISSENKELKYNKNHKLVSKFELLLHDSSKFKKEYIYKKFYLNFFYIEHFHSLPINFWEISNSWNHYLINIIIFLLKFNLDKIFKNFKKFQQIWSSKNSILIIYNNYFFRKKLYTIYNNRYINTKKNINLMETLHLSLPSVRLANDLTLNAKKNIFKYLQFYENINYHDYHNLYLNKYLRNILFMHGDLYPKFFDLQTLKNIDIFEDILPHFFQKNKIFNNLVFFQENTIFFINKFFFLILFLYKKNNINFINQCDLINYLIIQLKLICTTFIK